MSRCRASAHGSCRARPNFYGAALSALGLALLVYALQQLAESTRTEPLTCALAVLGVALLAGFVIRQRRTSDPLLRQSLGAASGVAEKAPAHTGDALLHSARDAFDAGFSAATAAVLALLAILTAFLLRTNRNR